MGEELKQCLDRERYDRDRCGRERGHDCDSHESDCDHHHKPDSDSCREDEDGDILTWILIIVVIFLLCGGTSLFGGNSCTSRDECSDNNGFGIWIVVLVLIFLFMGNQREGSGGFLGGLFG